jgi:hypothetical protein
VTDDELRDELAKALQDTQWYIATDGRAIDLADAALPVVRRYADAQVAAQRDRVDAYRVNRGTEANPDWVVYRWRTLIAFRVNHGTKTEPDWVMHHPSDVEFVYPNEAQP